VVHLERCHALDHTHTDTYQLPIKIVHINKLKKEKKRKKKMYPKANKPQRLTQVFAYENPNADNFSSSSLSTTTHKSPTSHSPFPFTSSSQEEEDEVTRNSSMLVE
jgi:hypothetical protein